MSDTAFKTAPFPGFTSAQLRAALDDGGRDRISRDKIETELARRDRIAAGDVSMMTPGERLRFIRSGKAR